MTDTQNIHSALVLIVDDVELNRKLIETTLRKSGYGNLLFASDGEEALALTLKQKPDIVILDIMMPKMDGFAYCREIRSNREFDHMPILVQTVLEETEKKIEAFKLGASDYVCKPIEPLELLARFKVHLGQKKLIESLKHYKTQMHQELDAARQTQQRLQPSLRQIELYERMYAIDIGAHFQTSSDLGGDSWGMHALSDNKLALWIYDFSGHGITAALNVFRMHTLMQECMQHAGSPGLFLTHLNRRLNSLIEKHEFATMFYGVIDTDANCLCYSSASAPPPLLLSAYDKPVWLNTRGFPIGVVESANFETKYTPFTEGDTLLLYSDCLVETKGSLGNHLSDDTIEQKGVSSLSGIPAHPAKTLVNDLIQLIDSHQHPPLDDDLTLLACHRKKN